MKILLELLLVAIAAIAVAKLLKDPWKARAWNVLKAWLTVRMVWVLLEFPIKTEGEEYVPAWQLILDTLANIDAATFWTFAGIGALIRFSGVVASMFRWQFVLLGQAIEMPFRHIFGAFLIGRAIGFFLPSTAGLDAYKLYDAARFSGKTVEVTAGTVLEKVLGVSGIFLTFLIALPFGYPIFADVFGDLAFQAALVTVALSSTVIGGLLAVLWFPGLVQWVIEKLPLPGKARLEGVVLRISNATAAYRDKKMLVLGLLGLSFLVHFTTASMYYFMAIAVGAGANAAFWPIVFGSAIQIFATVIGPTIGGLGVREAAQAYTLGGVIGVGPAIVSATLGFWVGELPTLLGFGFWLTRGPDYRPAYCRVNGQQVDYEEAAKAAASLEEPGARHDAPTGELAPFGQRALWGAGAGLGGGILAGLLVGIGETLAISSLGFGTEAQVLWYGPLAYATVLGVLGALGGIVLAVLPMDEDEIRAWVPPLALLALMVPFGLAVTVFRLMRDVYLEQMPPTPVLLAVLGGFGVVALLLFFVGPRVFRSFVGQIARPLPALGLAAMVAVGGFFAAGLADTQPIRRSESSVVPVALANRPNLILVMVDTLRADHLSCYGATDVKTPNLCRVATDGGTVFDGYAHSSWTKPSTATLLTSLLPTSHQTMSKPSALPDEIDTVAEKLRDHGYATGGIVSNTNLTEAFGFAQGFDEYTYLGPDYLAGAQESSSKLVLYQIARRVWFRLPLGISFGGFYQDSQVINRHAFDFLDRNDQGRFFLFLHYMDPHDPYFEHPYDGYGIARASMQNPPPEMAAEMRRLYVEEIEYLDANFGKLIARLEQADVYHDTAIVLVSDHGEEFNEHGGFWHGLTLYDEQIRVPLLVKWPAGDRQAPADATSHQARIVDVAPTLLGLAGAPIPDAMQGLDLRGGVAGRSDRDRMVFAEEDHEGNVLRALRTEKWKWMEANPGNPRGLPEEELFHVADDPGETRNRAADAQDVARELRGHADGQQMMAEQGKVGEAKQAQLSDSERAYLEALGYVQGDEEEVATP